MIKSIDALTKIVTILEPLDPEERNRIVRAALTLLGDGSTPVTLTEPLLKPMVSAVEGLPSRAQLWMKQQNLSRTEIDEMFHITPEKAELIGEVPGKDDKEKTHNAYILAGVESLLATGKTSFKDEAARRICNTAGCYQVKNHSTYLKDKGNHFTGGKESGWEVTGPGLKQAALLIKKTPSV